MALVCTESMNASQEFATGQYEAHKVHPEGNRSGHAQQEHRRNEY